jgi:hypothetical protein
MLPEGSAKVEAFANGPTVIKYNPIAGQKPEIVTFKGITQEMFQFADKLPSEMEKISGVQGTSRGSPPPGVRAASMLRFFEEQEEQRASTAIIKHNEIIRRILYKAASVIGDYYPTSSRDRLIRVVGKENEYLIDHFQNAKISSEYDVIIVNSTGFSRSMSGRLEEISLINEINPKLLTDEQKADILELKNPQKAYDIATSSLKTAQLHQEMFLSGRAVPTPKPYWDLIVHWQTHIILLNSPQWERVSPKIQSRAEDHILAIEMLMEDKAKGNQAFAAHLGTLEGFPALYVLEPAAPSENAAAGPKGLPGRPPDLASNAPLGVGGPMPDAGLAAPPPPPQAMPEQGIM